MLRYLLIFGFLFSSLALSAQSIQWISMAQAQEAMKREKRKIIVDVYTDWCGWCKRMDASTFTDPEVVKLVNANFYAVRLDAEQREELVFKGKTYKFVANGQRGYNALAQELLGNKMSFPTVVFLDEQLANIQSLPGFREAEQMQTILAYFAQNAHKTTPWSKWEQQYHPVDTAPPSERNLSAPANRLNSDYNAKQAAPGPPTVQRNGAGNPPAAAKMSQPPTKKPQTNPNSTKAQPKATPKPQSKPAAAKPAAARPSTEKSKGRS